MDTSLKMASPDIEIIDKVLLGNIQSFEYIVRKYNPYLYRIGKTYGFEHQDVQDIMQETYVNAYRNLAGFKRESSFRTWLTRIMLNNCYHKKQKLKSKKEISADSLDGFKTMDLTSETMRNTKALNKELKDGELFVNLASNEYFSAIDVKALKAPVITPEFKDYKNGKLKIISFFAKKARGMMVRYIIDTNAETIEDLKGFNYDGYQFDANLSEGNQLVFTR